MSAIAGAPNPGAADALPLMSELGSAPSFRIAFRGYDSSEVNRWARLVEAQAQAVKAAHTELAADVRSLAEQLDRAHEELAILRRRPAIDDTIAFRHLGPRIEQILADAHAEAEEIRRAAQVAAERLRETTEEQLRSTREEHAQAVAEFDAHRQWLQEEEERWTRLLHSRQDSVARADEYRSRVRRDAEELLEAATAQHERMVASAMARTEQMLAQASTQATAIREAARRVAVADQEAAATARAEAEQQRDAMRQEAERAKPSRRADGRQGPDRQDEAAAAAEAVGSAEVGGARGEPAVGKGPTGAPTAAAEPVRGVAKVVYVVNTKSDDEPEGEESPVEPQRSTVDAR